MEEDMWLLTAPTCQARIPHPSNWIRKKSPLPSYMPQASVARIKAKNLPKKAYICMYSHVIM